MVEITEYAVRRRGTQEYLARPQRRDGRGGSHLEPVDFSKPKGKRGQKARYEEELQIRSYPVERAAKNLLSAWLQGKFVAHRSAGGYPDYDYDEEISCFPVPERRREDMEIVKITIILPD